MQQAALHVLLLPIFHFIKQALHVALCCGQAKRVVLVVPSDSQPLTCFCCWMAAAVLWLQASLGTARLLVQALQQHGLSAAAAKSRIWMVDSKGLILNTRQMLPPEKAEFARSPANLPGGIAAAASIGFVQSDSSSSTSRSNSSQDTVQRLAALVAAVQPTALIGAAAVKGAFGQPVVEAVTRVRACCSSPSARLTIGTCHASPHLSAACVSPAWLFI